MKKFSGKLRGPGTVELLEEAAGLVRRASVQTLCCYYLGSIPFAYGFLYFFSDMAGRVGAGDRLIPESLGLALLYIWMKCWQAVYAHRLRAELQNVRPLSVSPLRLALAQIILQPWWFILAPITLVMLVPFGWCFGLFQNITVLGCDGDARTVLGKARGQAGFLHGRNTVIFLFFLLFSLVVFLNLMSLANFLPDLLKEFAGVETVFSRSPHVVTSSTFLLFLAASTYLCVDPFLKAVYVLRCFHGESIRSGADLLTELRALLRMGTKAAMILVCLSLPAVCGISISAASPATTPGQQLQAESLPAVDTGEMDRAIGKVINRPEFSWRLPPKPGQKEEREAPGFVKAIRETLSDWFSGIKEWWRKIAKKKTPSPKVRPSFGNGGWSSGWVPIAMYLLVAVLLSVLGVMLWRYIKRRKKKVVAPAVSEELRDPDISDQAVTAAELTGDRWYRLACELFDRGETRLALRALYFSCIVHLSEEGFLTMDRSKSDCDYVRELRRRAHSRPPLIEAFSGNVAIYQCTWYGSHRAEQNMIDIFTNNYKRIVCNDR